MIRMKEWFGWRKEESRVDRKYRLAEELAAMQEEDVREVIRFAKPGMHLAKNGKKGRRAANGTADIS